MIIPIYKVEAYLKECVESVLSQSYTNLEIILVDDGSPDGCPAICDSFGAADSRVIVIHQKNGGLSDARNAGLRAATGDYFYFVDSDDRLPTYSVAWMVDCIHSTKADMVIAGFERFSDETGDVFSSTCPSGNEIITEMTRAEAMKDFYRDGCQAWAVLYKREVHEGIFFPYGEINEDEAVVFHLLERCHRVTVTNKVVYSYRNRSESITTSDFSVKKLAWQKHCADNLAFVREKYPELEADAAARYRGSLLWSLSEIAMSDNSFTPQVRELVSALRKNRVSFRRLPFQFPQDKIRLALLMYLPFPVYRTLLRKKRRAGVRK